MSVIIPCFNYGRFLPQSVDSALSQRAVDVEVIVVDDASDDGSDLVAGTLAERDPRVTLVCNPTNLGHVRTFNRGYEQATGEFVVRLDADDLLTPGSLARSVALFDSRADVGLVYGRPRHFTGSVPPAPRLTLHSWKIWDGSDWLAERCRLGVNCITTPEAVVRNSVLRDVGALDTRLRFAQDMELWLRVSAVSNVGYVDGPDQALHRDHSGSMSVTTGAGIQVDLEERRHVFDAVFGRVGDRIPNARELHELARRRLAEDALSRACRALDRDRFDPQHEAWFVDFALATYPDARQLRQWRMLKRRHAIGPQYAPYVPPFVIAAIGRRATEEYRYLKWTRTGV